MHDFDDKNHQAFLLQLAQDAIVCDSIAPQTLQGTNQRMAVKLRVIKRSNLILKVCCDPALPLAIQFT